MINAGVVVKFKFCQAKSKVFSNYINYIDRSEAIKTHHQKDYNMFAMFTNYMDDEDKQLAKEAKSAEAVTALFNTTKRNFTQEDKAELKDIFTKAQDKGSLMWQGVISFDNRYLEKYGVLVDNVLDEDRLKDIAIHGVGKLQKEEHLENATWVAAIHYNTDNIHVHIAMVEENPQRELKTFVDKNGVSQKGYKGKFRLESLRTMKSQIASDITMSQEKLRDLTLIRNTILSKKKQISLLSDMNFRDNLLEIYDELKIQEAENRVYRNNWKYGRKALAHLRPMLDNLAMQYIETYRREEFKEFVKNAQDMEELFKESYGGVNNYLQERIDDLFKRIGNSILKELVEYDKEINEEKGSKFASNRNLAGKPIRNTNYQTLSLITSISKVLNDDVDKWLNQKAFRELTFEIEH